MKIHNVDQNSDEWMKLRAGKPTASEFGKVVTSTGAPSKSASDYAMTLAAEAFAGGEVESWSGNHHTERGHELEAEAISAYEFMHDATVERVGFLTNDDETMGCSPDGIVGGDGMIEIKCLSAKEHVKALLYYQKHKKAPPKYFQQTQGQMMIAGRQWCDLYFYHPTLPKLAVRQTPDIDFVIKLSAKLIEVAKERDNAIAVMEKMS